MRFRLNLAVAALAVATTAALAAEASAATVTFPFNLPSGPLGTTHTYTSGGLSIFASGFKSGPTAVGLYGKNDGVGEQGVGLVNDPSGQNEITVGSFVQLDDSALIGKVTSLTAGFAFNSSTGGESWAVYGSNTAGVLGTLLTSGSDEALHTFSGIATYRYFDFTSTKGNVLLNSVAVTPIAAPEPLSLTLIGSGMLALGAMVRRRKN